MKHLTRRATPILVALSALATISVIVLYVIALSVLAGGPSIAGYDLLDIANRGTWLVAGIVVVTVWSARLGKSVAVAAGGLALASGIVGGVCGGLWLLGTSLSGFQNLSQPLELNSLLLAVSGTGYIVAPAAVVLAIGSLIVAATPFARARLTVARPAVA